MKEMIVLLLVCLLLAGCAAPAAPGATEPAPTEAAPVMVDPVDDNFRTYYLHTLFCPRRYDLPLPFRYGR